MSQQAVDVVLTLPKKLCALRAVAEKQHAWLHATRIRLRSVRFEPAGHDRQATELAKETSRQLAASTSMLETSTNTLEVLLTLMYANGSQHPGIQPSFLNAASI